MIMSSKLVAIGSLCLAGAVVLAGAVTHAGNINTSGVVCHSYNAAQRLDIDHLVTGVRNLNQAARQVVCAVPRSPLAAGAIPTFWIDGHDDAGTCTSCTATMFRFTGVMAASHSVKTCAPATSSLDWTQVMSFPTNPEPDSAGDYVRVLCTLPGRGTGIIYGITATTP
jgi:hypothetical protein